MSTPVVDHASEQRVVEVGMSTTVLDHTPRGHASRYVSACYTGMRDDVARTSAYRQAIIEAAADFMWSEEMQESIDAFSTNHASMFDGAEGVEGEHRLEWTQAHR